MGFLGLDYKELKDFGGLYMYKHFKVLVVEDDPATLLLMGKMLNSIDEFDIVSSPSANEALNEILKKRTNWKPDLVLSDFMMNNGDGMELLAGIRQEWGATIPVVFVTCAGNNIRGELLSHQQNIAVVDKPLRLQNIKDLLSKYNLTNDYDEKFSA